MKPYEVVDSDLYTDRAVELIEKAMGDRQSGAPFHMFLSGGSTPGPIYAALAARPDIDWTKVHIWFGDERFVPQDHPDSNYRMARETMLDKLSLQSDHVHPWPILSTPELAAETYEREFVNHFQSRGHTLDLQLLGMGDDGHTASLFPGTAALEADGRFCVANRVPGKESTRLTLTYPALALSRHTIFLVKGEGKAEAVREVLKEEKHPAARVESAQTLLFLLDQGAASKL